MLFKVFAIVFFGKPALVVLAINFCFRRIITWGPEMSALNTIGHILLTHEVSGVVVGILVVGTIAELGH